MIVVREQTLGRAWIAATSTLLDSRRAPGGKAHQVVVGFPVTPADAEVVSVVDRFLVEAARDRPSAGILRVDSVANTIFPEAFYLPGRVENPRQHLYDTYQARMRCHRRRRHSEKETYFSRLTGTDGTAEGCSNQLEALILKMKHQLSLTSPKSSIYELGVSEVTGDLRVYLPGQDRSIMGFPCLSHVSITIVGGAIHLTAQYRNQHFIRKALGNYVGLSHLCMFVASEVGVEVGDVCCVASHADAELGLGIGGKTRYRHLLDDCRSASAVAELAADVA